MTENVEIINYDSKFKSDFKELNMEWLQTYFYVEPHDEEVLNNPESYILDNDGYIFFAKYNKEIIGTVALINESEAYELSKMAITPKYRGLKIGLLLMNHCIEFAKNKGWDRVILYSNRKLTPAINLYFKVGFKEIPLEPDIYYERANIKMELNL